jgi:hypothetical protein
MKEETPISRWWLLLAAVSIGVGVVTGANVAFTLLTGRPLPLLTEVAAFQMALVAFPFVLLALLGARHWSPWVAGLVPTIALWGWYLFEDVRYQWSPDGSGANIGSGIILVGSPLVIAAISVGTFVRRKRAASRH